jgi:hypothetical protein
MGTKTRLPLGESMKVELLSPYLEYNCQLERESDSCVLKWVPIASILRWFEDAKGESCDTAGEI